MSEEEQPEPVVKDMGVVAFALVGDEPEDTDED
jgi:hypothetical protein